MQRPGIMQSWLIWLLAAFLMLYQYGIQVVPSMKVSYIKKIYLVTDVEVGMLNTFFLLPYVLLQIPAGIIVDQFNIRNIFTISMLIFAMGTLSIFFSDYYALYPFYILGHLLMGIAASCGFIGTLYLANLWLSEKSYRVAIGLTEMFAILGTFAIVIIFEVALKYLDWSQLIFSNFIFCIFFALLFWLYIQDIPKPQTLELKKSKENVILLLKNKQLLMTGLYLGCAFAHIIVLTNTWRIDFLEQHYHLSQIDATLVNGFSTLGYMVGAPFFGVLSHKVKNVIPIMFYAALIESILLAFNILYLHDLHLKMIFYAIVGFFTGAVTIGFSLVKDYVKPSMIGTGIGILNMGQICVGMILSPIFGELLDLFHDNYVWAATPVILCVFISVYAAYWLWKKGQSPELPARATL
ncbi:major facilitator family transporter [Legionella pneumophila]|uniref:Lysosomal dipeptide transporter MFSD1 n=2 Tax=Legionella pneumophila TaxID=446 RepID=A0A378K7R7_LEGPN|nr:major facilitator family transporter [Legionella pneumophila]CZH48087.1 D-galactarate permease [Legionella pneumophila]CZI53762.1 D-galactarate permease [Legionella pneumophila]CZI72041.1 D-galactarate permease [Legionella pneumophila]CZJ04246.1 D-galactarate permease [Legionella pneumophila]